MAGYSSGYSGNPVCSCFLESVSGKKLAAAEAQLWREQAGTSQKEGKAGYGQVQNTIEYKGKPIAGIPM